MFVTRPRKWVRILTILLLTAHATDVFLGLQATPTTGDETWLLTISFDQADLATVEGETGEATVVLTGVHPSVVAFTDEPARRAAVISIDEGVAFVRASAAEPLNADLVATSLDTGDSVQLIVELKSIDHDAGAVTLSVVSIAAFVNGNEISFSDVASGLLGPGYLFVDDAGAHGAAVGSPGVLSGNVIQVPIHVPVNETAPTATAMPTP